MTRSTTPARRLLAMSLATALTLALVLLITARAGATEDQTCNDVGPYTNLTASTSGPWGSVTFSDTEPTLTLIVAEGYQVRLCVKAGSANQGLGPEITGWFDEGTYEIGHTSGKDLSHYGVEFETVTTTVPEVTTSAPTTTTTESTTSSSTTTMPTTTSSVTTTSSSPVESTTTTSTRLTTSPAPTTSVDPNSPEELPFTGVEDWLAPVAGGLALLGLISLSVARRLEDD